jgi:regulator of sigma E protease
MTLLSVLSTIGIFVSIMLILGLLVFVHELGHFLAAKRAGVRVEEFAFGFPPRLFARKFGETTYAVNWIPLGGYVKMLGEVRHSKSPRSFSNKSFLCRAGILVSGVVMNYILAAFLLAIGFGVGMSPLPIFGTSEEYFGAKVKAEIIIAKVISGSPAALIGLKEGDEIIAFRDDTYQQILKAKEVPAFTKAHAGQTVTLVIKRENRQLERTVTLLGENTKGEGYLGVQVAEKISKVQYRWWQAPFVGLWMAGKILVATFAFVGEMIKNLVLNFQVPTDVAGPVGIFYIVGQAIPQGWEYVLQLVAVISVNLAVLNILPFPVFDGGWLLFITIEKIRGKRVSPQIQAAIQNIGFLILLILVALVTYFDILRIRGQ